MGWALVCAGMMWWSCVGMDSRLCQEWTDVFGGLSSCAGMMWIPVLRGNEVYWSVWTVFSLNSRMRGNCGFPPSRE